MKLQKFIIVLCLVIAASVNAQYDISIKATLVPASKSIDVQQKIVFQNTSNTAWNELYLHDWANSFSSKTTPLAKRFAENYNSSFHFEKQEDRGKTSVASVTDSLNNTIKWNRDKAADIITIPLQTPLMPGETFTINLVYTVKLPNSKFTRFGVTDDGTYKLKHWYISPAVFDEDWQVYSNKNTDDLFLTPSHFAIEFRTPKEYSLTTDLQVISESLSDTTKTTFLQGKNRNQVILFLEKQTSFQTIETDKFAIITNLRDEKISPQISALAVDRIAHFLDSKLGPYPFEKMVISDAEYRNNPVYGLNQLPDFISPFPAGFEYDMEQLKTITRKYIETSLSLNPRKDNWLIGALQIHLMMDYVDTYYPKMKILGSLSNFWVIKWAHAADLEFNDQYPLLYLNMARNNLQQPLTTPRDSLVKFNKNIATDYYGGYGLKYLSDYLGKETVLKTIQDFYSENKLKAVNVKTFEKTLQKNTALPINWFFTDYVDSRTTIDFRIKKVKENQDSLTVTVKNTRKNTMPVSIYGINNDSIIFKKWMLPFTGEQTVTVPKNDVRKLVLNYEKNIPEYNQRNNYKAVKGLLNRPLQFRLFQDVGDSRYNQIFFMPEFQYNLYDGFVIGPKVYNKTVLAKGFHYRLTPQIGLKSKELIGSGSVVYTKNYDKESLYAMRYGFAGSYFSYDRDLFYRRYTPFITFAFRNKDLRDNEKQFINLRSVSVIRDENPRDPDQDPNYSVFNLQYVYSNPNLINYFRGVVDYEISSKFSKISTTLEYRKLFLNNRQLNLRFFAGAFLFNDTRENDDFFSFALDRPTDYLFDYNYYGRSEQSGLFSQQLIVAEGGFKSQLQPKFANSWITTVNVSTNIWKWIYAYGDAGLIHNTDTGTQGVFDTGIRMSLVADYFELYFPLYSNLGWEPGLDDYDQRIRFIVTLDVRTLLGLFTRKWY